MVDGKKHRGFGPFLLGEIKVEIKYVPMPITFEQKREYNRQGFRVVDARFAPEGAAPEGAVVESTKEETPRRQRRAKSGE